jgi:hypothetical protein
MDLTDRLSEDQIQHNCFRIVNQSLINREIILYCISESLSKYSKENISSQQLYLWCTPIDLIEDYQSYLTTSNNLFLERKIFYSCTLPRFSSMCQYKLVQMIHLYMISIKVQYMNQLV